MFIELKLKFRYTPLELVRQLNSFKNVFHPHLSDVWGRLFPAVSHPDWSAVKREMSQCLRVVGRTGHRSKHNAPKEM